MNNQQTQQKKQCHFCVANLPIVYYKNGDLLRKFMTVQSNIMPRRRTGICAKHQRSLARAIKRARFLKIVPYLTR